MVPGEQMKTSQWWQNINYIPRLEWMIIARLWHWKLGNIATLRESNMQFKFIVAKRLFTGSEQTTIARL